jgi:transcriptional regulator of acetoin/glycerol metabolism
MTATDRPPASLELPALVRVILDNVADGVVVLDRGGRPLFVNESAKLLLGVSPLEGVGGNDLRDRALAHGGRLVPFATESGVPGEAVVVPAAGEGTLAERERLAILSALDATQGRLAETARRLGISRTTLWRRLKTYGLEREAEYRWHR